MGACLAHLCLGLVNALAEATEGRNLKEQITALFGDHTQHLTWHWKKQEDIGRWELCKSALPLNTSLYAVLHYLGISMVHARNQMDLGTYLPPMEVEE